MNEQSLARVRVLYIAPGASQSACFMIALSDKAEIQNPKSAIGNSP